MRPDASPTRTKQENMSSVQDVDDVLVTAIARVRINPSLYSFAECVHLLRVSQSVYKSPAVCIGV